MSALAVTPRRVLRSEWIKLTTLQSTVFTLVAAVGTMIGLSLLVSFISVEQWDTWTAAERADMYGTESTLIGRQFAELAIGVVGVIVITGEYATGMIRATLAAVPRRLPVLWAKLGVVAAVTLVLMLASCFVAFFVGNAILAKHWDFSISDPGVLRAIVMTAVTLTAVGVWGTALGFILRNTAAAIATLFGILMVLPIVGVFSPTISKFLPTGAIMAVTEPLPEPDVLGPGAGFALLCGYVVVAIAGAAYTLRSKDA